MGTGEVETLKVENLKRGIEEAIKEFEEVASEKWGS